MPGLDPLPEEYPDGGVWPTASTVVVGGATLMAGDVGYEETKAKVAIGGASTFEQLRRSMATVLECCRDASATSAQVRFGSATWHASPKTDADGLARYYPLWLVARDASGDGRDIAHAINAGGVSTIQDGEDGKMCELPEQFRLGRYYDVPITSVLDPQPSGLSDTDPAILQWEWSRGFTASLLYRYRAVRQEQSLFSLSPVLRFGVSWLGELAVEVTLENGNKLNAWSTQRLSAVDWSHIGCTFDPDRMLVAMHLNGARVIELPFTRAIGAVDGCYIGRWNGGSLMNGEAQDVRIYDSVLRTEFIAAESNSYCADWVEVV